MSEITDKERLDFMLVKGRHVLIEIRGYNSAGENHFHIYVAEGAFHDFVYPTVHFTGVKLSDEDSLPLQRQAIDLAIQHHQKA